MSETQATDLLGGLYVEQVARSVAVAAATAHLLLALTAEPQLETGHAAAATALAAPVSLLKELPALTRCTEQLYAVLRGLSVILPHCRATPICSEQAKKKEKTHANVWKASFERSLQPLLSSDKWSCMHLLLCECQSCCASFT